MGTPWAQSNVTKLGQQCRRTMDDLEIAEDLRRQLQAAAAGKNNIPPISRSEFLKIFWEKQFPALIRRYGVKEENIPEIEQYFRDRLARLPQGAAFDDLGPFIVVHDVSKEVIAACESLALGVQNTVAIGPVHLVELVASQARVPTTEASIIQIAIPMISFCSQIGKVMAHTIFEGVEPTCRAFKSAIADGHPPCEQWLLDWWKRILLGYASEGAPNLELGPVPKNRETWATLMHAMEVFMIAHEYGHHVAEHGPPSEQSTHYHNEHEADLFAHVISIRVATQTSPFDYFLTSGGGGALILGTLELVARAKAVLETGSDKLSPSETHPPVKERIAALSEIDKRLKKIGIGYSDFRLSVLFILDTVWEALKPTFEHLHREGIIRPSSKQSRILSWLPLTGSANRPANAFTGR